LQQTTQNVDNFIVNEALKITKFYQENIKKYLDSGTNDYYKMIQAKSKGSIVDISTMAFNGITMINSKLLPHDVQNRYCVHLSTRKGF
jgi:hypothetical protein